MKLINDTQVKKKISIIHTVSKLDFFYLAFF